MWKADHNGIWVHKGTMETNHQPGTLESNKEDWHKQSTLKYLIYFFYVLLKWEIIYYTSALYIISNQKRHLLYFLFSKKDSTRIIYYTSALYIMSNQKRNKYCILKFISLVWTSIPRNNCWCLTDTSEKLF